MVNVPLRLQFGCGATDWEKPKNQPQGMRPTPALRLAPIDSRWSLYVATNASSMRRLENEVGGVEINDTLHEDRKVRLIVIINVSLYHRISASSLVAHFAIEQCISNFELDRANELKGTVAKPHDV